MSGPDAPKESDSKRDGFLSYAAEWHSLSHGVYDGMRDWRVRPKQIPNNKDVQKEPHYYKGGYVIGTVLQGCIAVGLGHVSGLF